MSARVVFDCLANEQGVITWEAFRPWYSSRIGEVGEGAPGPAKRRRVQEPQPEGTTPARKKAVLKAFITSLKKSIRGKKFYNHGTRIDCNAESMLGPGEFEHLFGAQAEKGAVTKKELTGEQVSEIFGDFIKGIKTQTYNRPCNFGRQWKTGTEELTAKQAVVNFSKNTSMCKIKFTMANRGNNDYFSGGSFVLGLGRLRGGYDSDGSGGSDGSGFCSY
eukprot:Hpha_TRINITY_DN19559_c0_g1::TRINITY_DN19559_c0_g1_i1::g.33619::m.33619